MLYPTFFDSRPRKPNERLLPMEHSSSLPERPPEPNGRQSGTTEPNGRQRGNMDESPDIESPAFGNDESGDDLTRPEVVNLPADPGTGGVARTLIFHRIDESSPPHFEAIEASEFRSRNRLGDSQRNEFEETDFAIGERESRRRRDREPAAHSPFASSITLLVTVGIMLASARFVVPPIVEEIRYAQHRGQLRAEFEVGHEGLKNVSLDTLSQAYQMVTAAAGPSVVHIDVQRDDSHQLGRIGFSPFPMDPKSDDDEDLRRHRPDHPSSDQGSGVIVDADGYILTNRHVIEDGNVIEVSLSDGRRVEATIVGTDGLTDLALLKVDADHLLPIPWGDSESIGVGSPVWALGSPFGLDRTVTFGILSGKHRLVRASSQYQDFMQSDVAVNPGNSGGPLVDARGTLIGINTAIVGDTYQGVSFSIPSSVAKAVYERLRETGTVERGWLGVFLSEVADDQLVGDNHRVRGALITGLADQAAGAAAAGLQPGDIILEMNEEPIRDVGHLMRMIGNALSGRTVALKVRREADEIMFDVTLGQRPRQLNVR